MPEPVSDEFLADIIRLGVALRQIDQDDADVLLAEPAEGPRCANPKCGQAVTAGAQWCSTWCHQADAIDVMASKISRGAVRPDNTRMLPAPEAATGKRYRLTTTHLQSVAAVYLEALRNGTGPTSAVATHFGVPHSTASKWVGKAREMGALRPTTKGVAR